MGRLVSVGWCGAQAAQHERADNEAEQDEQDDHGEPLSERAPAAADALQEQ